MAQRRAKRCAAAPTDDAAAAGAAASASVGACPNPFALLPDALVAHLVCLVAAHEEAGRAHEAVDRMAQVCAQFFRAARSPLVRGAHAWRARWELRWNAYAAGTRCPEPLGTSFAYSLFVRSFHARRDRVVLFTTVQFVWRGHANPPTTRAGPWPDFALRLE